MCYTLKYITFYMGDAMLINNQNFYFIILSFITLFALLQRITLLIIRYQIMSENFFIISQNYFWHLLKKVYYALITVPWWNGYHVSLTWMSRQFNSARDYQNIPFTVPWWNGYHISFTWMGRQFNSARDYHVKRPFVWKAFIFCLTKSAFIKYTAPR